MSKTNTNPVNQNRSDYSNINQECIELLKRCLSSSRSNYAKGGSVEKPFSFSETGKKDPCRGMRWVNPFESINKNRLGHSQSWRDNKSKKEYY